MDGCSTLQTNGYCKTDTVKISVLSNERLMEVVKTSHLRHIMSVEQWFNFLLLPLDSSPHDIVSMELNPSRGNQLG